MKKRNVLTNLLILFLSFVMLITLSRLVPALMQYKQGRDEYSALIRKPDKPEEGTADPGEEQEGYPELDIDFENLKSINGEFSAVLYFPYFDITYPVVYPTDNDAYVHTTFEGKEVFSGCLFFDAFRNNYPGNRNSIIYGHNMKDGSMFGKFKTIIRDPESFGDEECFYLYTEDAVRQYSVFSFYKTPPDSGSYGNPFTEEEYDDFVKIVKGKSLKSIAADFTDRPDIVTLTTCYGTGHKEFTVIHGVLVAEYEK